jgi:hypothetical protein
MPDEYRVTIRLSPELYTQLEVRGSHRQPMAAIVREALIHYLNRQPDVSHTPDNLTDTVAAMAASVTDLQQQVQALTARVEALAASEQRQGRQPAAATAASGRPVHGHQPRGGRPRSALGQRILTLLGAHPEGLSAEQIRVYVSPERPIGDILNGMRRTGAVQAFGQGRKLRYVLPTGDTSMHD